MAKVNLDALIPREDFEAGGQNNMGNLFPSISVASFSTGLFYPFLRKPDFQRETNEWDSKKIYEFLESFISGDLIPSIILWRSDSGYYFVIDGAHRLSVLTAWLYDDYGDGEISNKFYDGNLPEEQKDVANQTRDLISKKIGAYKDIIASASEPNISNIGYVKKAQNIGAYSIQVQWVPGDASKAESSFFKINQKGVHLNKTEIKLLESRRKGNCIAARAIKSAGTGHKYWSNFSASIQNQIQEISEEINKILFSPPLKTPVKSLDLPIAGKVTASQAIPLILDFVNIVNNLPTDFEGKLADDNSGEDTLRFLKRVRKVAWRMNSVHPSSLGLHPIVYFYSSDGRHKPASFYAMVAWIVEAESNKTFKEFIQVREKFEKLILKYDYLVQDINRKYRQAIKSFPYIKDFYNECISQLLDGKGIEDAVSQVVNEGGFNYLTIDMTKSFVTSADFTTERKSAVFIRDALSSAVKCRICNGLIHQNSITIDHKVRKQDGGTGSIDNGQIAHPYCNSTFKN